MAYFMTMMLILWKASLIGSVRSLKVSSMAFMDGI